MKQNIWYCIGMLVSMVLVQDVVSKSPSNQRIQNIIQEYHENNSALAVQFDKYVWSEKNPLKAQELAYEILRKAYDENAQLYGEEELSSQELETIWNVLKQEYWQEPLQKLKPPVRKTARATKTPLHVKVREKEYAKVLESYPQKRYETKV